MISYQHLVLVLVVILILYGGKQFPELARSLGKSMKEFKKGVEAGAEEGGPSIVPVPTATPSRTCGSCKTPLAAEWTHCPQCGTATP